MNTLATAQYDKAVTFLNHDARPLEKALYAYHLTNGSAAAVLDELAKFQNSDGGFGHGMEPDIRLADSSVIATSVAFQRLRELNAQGEHAHHPVVINACRYLLDTYNAGQLNRPIIPPNIDDAPHAPWWVHGGDLENSKANPHAELAGYVNDYASHFPDDMRVQITQSVMIYLLTHADKMEMHDLFCYLRLYETKSLPGTTKAPMLEKLRQIVDTIVERNPAEWRNYGLPPLAVISSPQSPFAEMFRDAIQPNLDLIIDSQREDGTWGPNWSWDGDAWQQAERDWTSGITLANLRKLHAFGRLA